MINVEKYKKIHLPTTTNYVISIEGKEISLEQFTGEYLALPHKLKKPSRLRHEARKAYKFLTKFGHILPK